MHFSFRPPHHLKVSAADRQKQRQQATEPEEEEGFMDKSSQAGHGHLIGLIEQQQQQQLQPQARKSKEIVVKPELI